MSNTDYPKVLYKDIWGDDIATVQNLEQEQARKEEGYADYADVFEAAGSPVDLPVRGTKPVADVQDVIEATVAPITPAPVTREQLDEALGQLPGDHKDPDFVVNGMRKFFGELFTDADEYKARELVKAPAKYVVPDPLPEDKDELKEIAKKLGIVTGNWGIQKLKAAIEEAKAT